MRDELLGLGNLVRTQFMAGVLATAALLASAPAMAQSLANLPGRTDLQSRVGASVAATCAGLAGAPLLRPAGSLAEDLFFRCREMVQNANAILGAGPTAFSLGMNADTLRGALNDIAHDEAAAQGTNSTQSSELQVENLSGRLSALRGGAPRVSTAGLSIRDSSGQQLAAADKNWLTSTLAAGEEGEISKIGVFATGEYGFGDDDGSSEEAAYDFDGYGLTAGADYRVSDNFIAGAALGYSRTDNDFDQDNGEMNQDTYSLSVYGSIFSGSLYVDGVLGYAFSNLDIDRKITYPTIVRTAAGETDGDDFSASASVGYDISRGAWSFNPVARVSFVDTNLDAYTETGALGLNLAVGDQNIQSLETTIGGDVSFTHSTNFGVVIPQLRLDWAHEFDNESRRIGARYINDPAAVPFFIRTDSPDRNYFNLGGGISALIAGGKTAFAEVESVLGREDYQKYTFRIGARFEL